MTQIPDIPQLALDLKTRLEAFGHENLGILSEFYADSQWHVADENTAWCFAFDFSALAATMYRYCTPRIEAYAKIAIETMDAALVWNLNTPVTTTPRYVYTATPSYPGSLFTGLPSVDKPIAPFDGGPWGTPDPVGSDENTTIEVIATFCWIIDELYEAKALTMEQAKAYVAKLKFAADWLIDWNGNPTWYTNGNYVAHELLAYGHLALLCRKFKDEPGWARYSQAYEQTIQTLIYPFGNNPPANAQWAGYGYVETVLGSESTSSVPAILKAGGTTSDGSSATGHLTETSGHPVPQQANTFDGVYSQLTLDVLTTLYMINRDWRVNYLVNALWNKLATISNFTTYLIDCSGGSRQGGVRGWTGGYQNVIGLIGRRTSNRTQITNAFCTGCWDNMVKANLRNNGLIEVNQVGSFHGRLFRINVATTLHCAYLVDKKLS